MTTSPDGTPGGGGTNDALARMGLTPEQQAAVTQLFTTQIEARERQNRLQERSLSGRARQWGPAAAAGGVAVVAASDQGQAALGATGDAIGRGVNWAGSEVADFGRWAGGEIAEGWNNAVNWASERGSEIASWAQQTGADLWRDATEFGQSALQAGQQAAGAVGDFATQAWGQAAGFAEHVANNPGQSATIAAIAFSAGALTNPTARQAVATAANAGNRWMRNAAAAIRHPAQTAAKLYNAVAANPRVQSVLSAVGLNKTQNMQATNTAAKTGAQTAAEQGKTSGPNFANDNAMAPASGATGGQGAQAGQAGQSTQTGQRESGAHRADKRTPDQTRGV